MFGIELTLEQLYKGYSTEAIRVYIHTYMSIYAYIYNDSSSMSPMFYMFDVCVCAFTVCACVRV